MQEKICNLGQFHTAAGKQPLLETGKETRDCAVSLEQNSRGGLQDGDALAEQSGDQEQNSRFRWVKFAQTLSCKMTGSNNSDGH